MGNLLNQFGDKIPNARQREFLNSAFVSGGFERRSMQGWDTSFGSADSDLLPELSDIRSRSRDLIRNTPLGSSIIDRAGTNVVGSGLRLQARVKRSILGLSDEEADRWERDVEARFDLWASSKDSDLARTNNFYDQTGLAFTSMLASGDVFALLPSNKRNGMDSDLRISLFEGDFVSNPDNFMDTEKLAGGIEVDKNHAPVNYFFRANHPGSENPEYKWIKVPAFGNKSGRRNVLHLFKATRPGERRGVPILSPVVETIKQISRYSDTELMAAVVSSSMTIFIKSDLPANDSMMSNSYASTDSVLSNSASDKKKIEIGSGSVIDLAPGESIDMADPTRPNQAFEPFFLAAVKQVGAAIGIPYEVLIEHFSSSYSASRAAILEFWKFVQCRRSWLVGNWCNPIYEAFLTEQILKGFIRAPGFLTNNLKRYAWLGSHWQGPARGMIDPLKEIKAAGERLRLNLTTHEDEYATIHSGDDWEAGMNRRARENTFLESKNLDVSDQGASGTLSPEELQLMESK